MALMERIAAIAALFSLRPLKAQSLEKEPDRRWRAFS